ncbi:hypothetical protein F443_13005, partial [Phytophthora nicotianae P1569]
MNDSKLSPKKLASLLGAPYSIDFTRLPKSDPMYRNLEAYTVTSIYTRMTLYSVGL